MSTVGNIPAIPSTGFIDNVNIKQVLDKLKESVEIGQGVRGHDYDRYVTIYDLIQLGVDWTAFKIDGNTAYNFDYFKVTGEADEDAPGPPTNFSISNKVFTNELTWTNPPDEDFHVVEVWTNTSNDRADAWCVGVIAGKPGDTITWAHSGISTSNTYYYWIRAVDFGFNKSTWNPTSQTGGEEVAATPGAVRIAESFYFNRYDMWAGNGALDNAATVLVIGDTDGTPKITMGPTADSITFSGTQPGFYADGNGDARMTNLILSGVLRTVVFEKDIISAVGGTLMIRPSDSLASAMTALDSSTLTIKGEETFANGDILRIKDGVDDEWMTITNATGAPTYVVTRDEDSQYGADSNPAWPKGASVVNYGQSGDGGILLTSSLSNAPYIEIFTHAGSPWDTVTTVTKEGNLNGYAGYSSDVYGWASYLDANNYITIDATNGIQMSGTLSITSFNALPSDENLVGYWPFNEASGTQAVDASGNGNHGTLTNGPTITLNGVSGRCLEFNDDDDEYVSIPDDIVDISAGCSLSMWINVYENPNNSNPRWFATVETGGDDFTFLIFGQDATPRIGAAMNGSGKRGSTALSFNTWYHVVATYDGTNFELYLNGVEESLSSQIPIASTHSLIGGGYALNSYTALGKIDQVRLYKSVLTAAEIKALYLIPSGVSPANVAMDSVVDGTYGKVLSTDISAGHILLSECTGDLDDIADGSYAKVLATDISAGHVLLAECSGDSDDISEGASNFFAGASGADFIKGSDTLDDITNGATYGKVQVAVLDSGYLYLLRKSADATERVEVTASGVEQYANNVKMIELANGALYLGDQNNEHGKFSSDGTEIKDGSSLISSFGAKIIMQPEKGYMPALDSNYYAPSAGTYTGVCAYGDYVFVAAGGGGLIVFYRDPDTGELTYSDNDDQGGTYNQVYANASYVLVGCDTSGLRAYTHDGAGSVTYKATNDHGGNYYGICEYNGYFLACGGGDGLNTYTFDGTNLTHIDNDDQGGTYYDVWEQDDIIFVAAGTAGLHTYTMDGSGNLTHVDTDYDGAGDYRGVHGDGTIVAVAGLTSGVISYSYDGAGNLTLEDSDATMGTNCDDIWHNADGYWYATWRSSGVASYYINNANGNINPLINNDQGGTAYGVWSDGTDFLYCANDNSVVCFAPDGAQIYIDPNGLVSMASVYANGISAKSPSALYITESGEMGLNVSTLESKWNPQPIGNTSKMIYDLNPISFEPKDFIKTGGKTIYLDKGIGRIEYGLGAEEVEMVDPTFVFYNHGKVWGVHYDKFIPLILNEEIDHENRLTDHEKRLLAIEAKLNQENHADKTYFKQ